MAEKKSASIPWARNHSHFTLMFEKHILKQVQNGTISGASKILREHDTRIWRVLIYYVSECRKLADFSEVKNLGIDETSKKGHNYLTTFVNLDSRKVMYVIDGKDNKTIKAFVADFKEHNGKPNNILNVTSDMSLAFEKGITENMPNAKIIIDKFHVIKYFNDALNKTLRDDIKSGYDLKKTKYIWMKNKENLTEKQLKKFDSISNKNTKTARAYRMKIAMQQIYQLTDKNDATKQLKRLIRWLKLSRNEHMKKLAKTLTNHFDNIMNYFDNRLTNAILEGTNNITQNIKGNARGYRNVEYFKTMIYLYSGDFEISVERVTHTK